MDFEILLKKQSKRHFKSLSEKEELSIICEIINYIKWYKKNAEKINKYIKEKYGKIDGSTIAEFWLNEVKKSKNTENYLKNIEVIADCHEYIEKYNKIIFSLVMPKYI